MGNANLVKVKVLFPPRMLLGIGLVLLGLVFTLDNLGLVDADEVLEYWPVLVIGVGLLKLMSHGPTAGALCWLGGGLSCSSTTSASTSASSGRSA